ncbi:MAG: ribonuclease III family protein [Candidatus Hodarchaeales archaeon]|jgi:hypothetical protein
MDLLQSRLKKIVQSHYSLNKIISQNDFDLKNFYSFLSDRRNASFGDSLINFVYSCAKSITANNLTGIKISDTILVSGYKKSILNTWLSLQGRKKDQANALEALVFYVWLVHNFSIQEMSLLLSSSLDEKLLSSTIDENRTAIEAFRNFFDACHHLLFEKRNE